MDERTENFWREWAEIGRELLSYGKEIGFGMSLIEVKFQAGEPSVIIRSKSIKKKYPNNEDAKNSIIDALRFSETGKYDGARTFTIAYRQGNITQVLLDEYSNQLLK